MKKVLVVFKDVNVPHVEMDCDTWEEYEGVLNLKDGNGDPICTVAKGEWLFVRWSSE